MITFLDAVGRTIIGEKVEETNETVTVKNPVVVHVVPQQEGAQVKMALQLFPLFFREFLGDKDAGISFKYNKTNITLPAGEVVFDFKLEAQYKQLFMPVPAMATPQASPQQYPQNTAPQAPVQPIKLFDD